MKKLIALLLCMIMIASCFAACGGGSDSETTAPAANAETEPVEPTDAPSVTPVEIKIWHDGDEAIMQTIADQVNAQLAAESITVVFEKKSGLSDQLKLYGGDAVNGPDMYLYAHDSLGTFVAMDILAPLSDVIDASVYADALPLTVQAGQLGGEQYLLPVYFETLLFLYNKDLWEGEIPSTTEELYDYMVAHTDVDAGTYAVVNQHSTAYNVAPFINGFGGYIINENAEAGLDDENTIAAVEYNKKFAALQADGDYNTVTTLFNEGKAAAIIGGPWLVSGIEAAGINYGIVSLSEFALPNGNALAPYSGVQGVGVMKCAVAQKKDAIAKVLTALSSAEVGIDLANKSGCAPANSKAYEDADVAANEMIVAIQKTAATAQPMPNIPEMGVMWGPAESLLAAVNKNGADVAEAAAEQQAAAEQAIADMQ